MTTTMTIVSDGVKYRRGSSIGLVPFLFGVCGRDELPGTTLTRLLGDLGLTTAAARAVIARMQRDGQLAGERRGRAVDYRMIGEFRRQFDRIRTADARDPVPWTGGFHALLFHVPEEQRAFRDALRRHALFAGYGMMQPGVLIALTDRREALWAQLPSPPAGARLVPARLELSTVDAAAAAYRAWDLETLGERYRQHLRKLRTELGRKRSLPAEGRTLRRWADLTSVMHVDLGRQPDLPPELLPSGWPQPDFASALAELDSRFFPAVREYVNGLGERPATDP